MADKLQDSLAPSIASGSRVRKSAATFTIGEGNVHYLIDGIYLNGMLSKQRKRKIKGLRFLPGTELH